MKNTDKVVEYAMVARDHVSIDHEKTKQVWKLLGYEKEQCYEVEESQEEFASMTKPKMVNSILDKDDISIGDTGASSHLKKSMNGVHVEKKFGIRDIKSASGALSVKCEGSF